MSVAPICPVHNKPMALRQGAHGPWFTCETFMGPGVPGANARGYCAYKPARTAPQAAPAAPVAAPAPEVVQRAAGGSPRLHAAIAALNAAAVATQGSGATRDGILKLASDFYHRFLKVAFTEDVPVYMDGPDSDIPF